MKNISTVILLAITGVFILLTTGFLIGRSIGSADVIISSHAATTEPNDTIFAYVEGGKLNINTADVAALCELPGIGETLAQRIITYREEHGNFKDIGDLLNVNGIGNKLFESISDMITIGG